MDPAEPTARRLPRGVWAAVAALASAVYTFFVLVLPARGLTFVSDDWQHLSRLATTPWPQRWLMKGFVEHWPPLMWVLLDFERTAFGLDHTFFVLTAWSLHVANVFLLGLLLEARTGDARAGALAAAAFGLTTHHRAIVWWPCSVGNWALCFLVTTLGFLALERYRASGSWRWLVGAAVAALTAPMCIGLGLALGPALALECLLLLEGSRRWRALATVLAGFGAYALLYSIFVGGQSTRFFPRSGGEVLLAARFGADLVGTGMVEGVLGHAIGHADTTGPASLAAYLVLVLALGAWLEKDGRKKLLLAHVYLALLVGPIALTRWGLGQGLLATESRYQYLPSIVWTTVLAFGLARARARRGVTAAALVGLAALALVHALGASDDRNFYAPAVRRQHPLVLEHLALAVRSAHGPVYDAELPEGLGTKGVRVAHMLYVLDPGTRATFTLARTPETLAPYRADPVLAELFGPF